MKAGRDVWWHDLVPKQPTTRACEPVDAEHPLFLLYTSGTTGKPKGILHTTGGYMVFTAATARWTFNLQPGTKQVYFCTADLGWITGHSYIVYGILPNRVPTLMYEGAPNWPGEDQPRSPPLRALPSLENSCASCWKVAWPASTRRL